MIVTNDALHGGKFKKQFLQRVKRAKCLTIATGYFGADLIQDVQTHILEVSRKGECRILLGMVFHGGISQKQKKCLEELDAKLRKINPANGVYISRKEYHGKVYRFDDDFFVGSSNFSREGFESRWECTAEIKDDETRNAAKKYLDFLFSQNTTEPLSRVALSTRTKAEAVKSSRLLKDYKIGALPVGKAIDQMEIKLRVDDQPASSLNLFFDKGRKNQKGLYAPRPWYEVELTSTAEDRKHSCYPKSKLMKKGKKSRQGIFNAFLVDGRNIYQVEMKVASDGGKALMSSKESGGRETLGRYIKGKLEEANVLKKGERITSDTLDAYGRDSITLKKIDDQNYILEF